jgi:hypothetical protein
MTPQKLKWYQAYREANPEKTKEIWKRYWEKRGREYYRENIEVIRLHKRKNYLKTKGDLDGAEEVQRKIEQYRLLHPRKRAGALPVFTPEEALERRKISHRKYRYRYVHGVPLTKAPDKCEVCGGSRKISMDHCHQTNSFRGWLCDDCNVALGLVKENITTLENMIQYLRKHELNA